MDNLSLLCIAISLTIFAVVWANEFRRYNDASIIEIEEVEQVRSMMMFRTIASMVAILFLGIGLYFSDWATPSRSVSIAYIIVLLSGVVPAIFAFTHPASRARDHGTADAESRRESGISISASMMATALALLAVFGYNVYSGRSVRSIRVTPVGKWAFAAAVGLYFVSACLALGRESTLDVNNDTDRSDHKGLSIGVSVTRSASMVTALVGAVSMAFQ